MSSITLKVCYLVDRLKLQSFFIEKNEKVVFTPIHIQINIEKIEKLTDFVLSAKGRPYQANQFEKDILAELEHRAN